MGFVQVENYVVIASGKGDSIYMTLCILYSWPYVTQFGFLLSNTKIKPSHYFRCVGTLER